PVHVLLIEDDTEAARFLVKGLRESGYTVEHASDGREGLNRAAEGQFDLIVTDRMLPQLDGLAIIERLRERRIETPVLVLSALGSVDDRIRGLKAGGDDYLTKPFALAMLLEGVWDLHFDPQSNLIDVHISRLRQAIDRGTDHPLIHTVRGSGYVLRADS